MADIEYRCRKCNAIRVSSEFADPAKLKCATCGESLCKAGDTPLPPVMPSPADTGNATPVPLPPPPGVSRLKLAKQRYVQDEIAPPAPGNNRKTEDSPEDQDFLRGPLDLHPKVKQRKTGFNHTILAFLLFALLGVITGFLRYGREMQLPGSEWLPADILAKAMAFAWAGILGLHLIIVFRAMSDNMFQGLLCLLVPGWSVVYLLFISDNFYLRAVVFGCLIGIGQDGGKQIYERAAAVMDGISAFIDTGGGVLRRTPPR
jgi:hypothetical protein